MPYSLELISPAYEPWYSIFLSQQNSRSSLSAIKTIILYFLQVTGNSWFSDFIRFSM
jgi:hypothetical protein